MLKKKSYPCTSKVKFAFQKMNAMEELADKYIKEDNHERAKRAQIDTVIQRDKAWGFIYELYPKLINKTVTYKPVENVVIIEELK